MATNPYVNSMMWATPGPDGQYGPPAGMGFQGMNTPGTPPGAMQGAGPNGFQSMPSTMEQYGYGNRPGQGGGYYEQQTPAGSFAAANQNQAGPAMGAYNPYIGRASGMNLGSNPYLGGSSGQAQAASNPYAGAGNPYTTQAIDAASADAARNYNMYIAPQRDAQMARSGSFGNSGVQQMQLEDQRQFGQTLGNIANTARMSDLFRQQDMGESAANRQTGVSQFNVGATGNDLTRNLAGTFAGQGLGLQGLGMDANLAQQLGMFNAGQGNQMSMFDAGQGNQMNMWNAGQGNQMLENFRNRDMGMNQFNQNMDRNIYNDNMNWMRTGQQDQLNAVDRMLGWQGTGLNAANQQRQQPITDWASFSNVASQLGGLGGITQQEFEANPWLGAIAGWMLGGR